MSYIDTIQHELVGYFNGLPIYHPLETVGDGKRGNYDFSCSPHNLVLGGGAGEHPGLVIHNLECLVAHYILTSFDKGEEYWANYSAPSDETIDFLHEIIHSVENDSLDFCGWSMKHMKDFIELAKSPLHSNPLTNEYDCEGWIKDSLGEFIYYSLPELNSKHEDILKRLHMESLTVGYWMNNVTCPPPNYIKNKNDSYLNRGFFRWEFSLPKE